MVETRRSSEGMAYSQLDMSVISPVFLGQVHLLHNFEKGKVWSENRQMCIS